jgi:hypothetical protein
MLKGLFGAVQGLMVSGLVWYVYKTAKESAEAGEPLRVIGKGLLYCVIAALFAASQMGEPSCEDGDPIHGGCDSYADDGYDPTREQRYERFAKAFVLLYAPVVAAAFQEMEKRRKAV